MELVHLDIRNQQAHRELQTFNDTGKFDYIHPLTVHAKYKRTQRDELLKLKKENPEAFLNEITNLNQNIRRIESNIRKKKYKDEQEHQAWRENLEKAKIKLQIIIELM
jgi:flagellar motility protein MotE (MotC chaperone)